MHLARTARPAHLLVVALALLAVLAALAAPGRLYAEAPDSVVEAAQADLAERLGGADPAAYELLRSEAVTWSDYCLGVYEPDTACATAIVDGFALWLSDGTVGYRYHTDGTGTSVRLAESGIPLDRVAGAPLPEGQVAPPDDEPAPPPPPVRIPDDAFEAAQADLAERLGGDDPAAYTVLRAEALTWRDGCLGVYEPDGVCTTALVDGFAVWLSDGEVAYRYHTDDTGTAVRLAESGIPLGQVAGAPLPEGHIEPPPDAPQPDDEPEAAAAPEGLPASGSGGLADSDVPAWVWGVIGAVAAAAVATGALYRLWLSRRR
ncbi:MAG: hypothetical protein OXG38_05440 [Chloroflexi bacterium]|nr:hypothetical protein [Chloroflexota bacterium]